MSLNEGMSFLFILRLIKLPKSFSNTPAQWFYGKPSFVFFNKCPLPIMILKKITMTDYCLMVEIKCSVKLTPTIASWLKSTYLYIDIYPIYFNV